MKRIDIGIIVLCSFLLSRLWRAPPFLVTETCKFLSSTLLAGCAAPGASSKPIPTQSIQLAIPTLEISDALRRDAQAMAEDMGIPVDEALRRMQYQEDIGNLQVALTANERETSAGLWIEHQPEYRIVVQFTRDGEQIQPVKPFQVDIEGKGLRNFLNMGRAALGGIASRTASLKEAQHSPADYDLIVIGTPVYAGSLSGPVRAYTE